MPRTVSALLGEAWIGRSRTTPARGIATTCDGTGGTRTIGLLSESGRLSVRERAFRARSQKNLRILGPPAWFRESGTKRPIQGRNAGLRGRARWRVPPGLQVGSVGQSNAVSGLKFLKTKAPRTTSNRRNTPRPW